MSPSTPKITPLTKTCFTGSRLHRKMAKIRLSRIKSSAFKISSYAGLSVNGSRTHVLSIGGFGKPNLHDLALPTLHDFECR